MILNFGSAQLDNWAPYAFFKEAFSPESCDRICGWFPSKMQDGRVGDGVTKDEIRIAKTDAIEMTDETGWLFRKLGQLAVDCNAIRWKFQVSAMLEGIQLTHYDVGGHYDWHTDNGHKQSSLRKLSAIIQLSDPSEYEGGNIEFIGAPGEVASRERGSLIVFPSYIGHRVTQVMHGKRRSAVAWISGDPYR